MLKFASFLMKENIFLLCILSPKRRPLRTFTHT